MPDDKTEARADAQDAAHEEPSGIFPFDMETVEGARAAVRPGVFMIAVLGGLLAVIGLLALAGFLQGIEQMFAEDATAEEFDRGLQALIGAFVFFLLASICGVLARLIADRSLIATWVAIVYVGLFLIGSLFLLSTPGFVAGIILAPLTGFTLLTLIKAMGAITAYRKLAPAQAPTQTPTQAPTAERA